MNEPKTAEWYVLTKLNPPLVRSHTVHRPKLERKLIHSVSTHALTLLSAPAGYGKTTLLATLPSLLPKHPLAWVTLDVEDNDPVRFMGLLATAFRNLHPQCGHSIWPLISGGINSDSEMRKVVAALINDIVNYMQEPIILVLDDLHFVTEPMVCVALNYLLDQRPPNLYVVVGTRNDPSIRLNRLAARGQLGEIRRSDLSLDVDQTQQLMNEILSLNLSPSELNILQERTEGWAGALCLLAGPLGRMANQDERMQFVAALNHSERRVFDFLAEEILLDLPDDIRSFLLKTSILSELTPSICNVVTVREDAEVILTKLYHRNLAIAAIAVDERGEPVYRYHSLFSRMLKEKLKQESAAEIADLHRKAAEVQKTPGRAIAHYLSATLWDNAIQLIIRYGMEMLHQGMANTVRQWYNGLPQDVRESYSSLTILMARCEIHRGDYEAASKLLNKVINELTSKEEKAEALASLITLAYHRGDRDAVESYIERALKLPFNPMAQVAVQLASAWLQLYDCNWDAVCTSVRAGLMIPSSASDRRADLIGITYTTAPMATLPGCMHIVEGYCSEVMDSAPSDTAWYLGAQELGTWPLLWRGHIDEALDRAEKAVALRRRLGGYPFVGNDLPALLGILYLAKGNLDGATEAVELLEQRIPLISSSMVMLHLHAAGRIFAYLSRWDRAMTMLQGLEDLDDGYKLTSYFVYHLRGLFALLRKEHDEATVALKEAIRLEDQLLTAHVGGSARLLFASLLLENRRSEEALAMAEPVLHQWNDKGLPGYAVVDGPIIFPVLSLASDSHVPGALSMWKLFSGNSDFQPKLRSLSPREREVLKLLVAGHTNREIAAKLYVSPETVKSHIASIFRKIGVRSRTQAALCAREMGFS